MGNNSQSDNIDNDYFPCVRIPAEAKIIIHSAYLLMSNIFLFSNCNFAVVIIAVALN